MNGEKRVCQNCKQEFVVEPEDFSFYEKVSVPAPTFCPSCRLQRRLAWRDEYVFYQRQCGVPSHSEPIFSLYSPDKPYIVYDQPYWWSDNWDALSYGRDYDFSRPFFAQFKELFDAVPKQAMAGNYANMINSEYSNWAGALKNCYLITDADFVEDSAYGSGIYRSKDCLDCDMTADSELCYDCFNIKKCSGAISSVDCEECFNVRFCKNCVGCTECFGCVNLRNKSYCIFNKSYTKEQYHATLKEIFRSSHEDFKKYQEKLRGLSLAVPFKYMHGSHNADVLGDYVYNSKNAKYAFFVFDAENSKFVSLIHSKGTRDCYDYTDWGEKAQLLYECSAVGLGAYNITLSHMIFNNVKDIAYSNYCVHSSNLFGCVGVRNKKYCILNKQYSQGEYETLVPKIIKQMNDMPYKDKAGRVYCYGEFFPIELSPFGYNETVVQEYFFLTKEQAEANGYAWKEQEQRAHTITIPHDQVPSTMSEVKDDVLQAIIACQHQGKCLDQCTGAFRIIPQELSFYRRMNIPLPRLCPRCRHYQRIKERNPLKLWNRQCQCVGVTNDQRLTTNNIYKNTAQHFHKTNHCPNQFETSYAPERKEIVYCEQCYLAEVA